MDIRYAGIVELSLFVCVAILVSPSFLILFDCFSVISDFTTGCDQDDIGEEGKDSKIEDADDH